MQYNCSPYKTILYKVVYASCEAKNLVSFFNKLLDI